MPPDVFARKVLDRVARNLPVIIVPTWWRLVWWLNRLTPWLADWLAVRAVMQTRQEWDAALAAGSTPRGDSAGGKTP
jgi:hypothetical protein